MVDLLLKLRSMDLVFGEVPLVLRYDRKAFAGTMEVLGTVRAALWPMFRHRTGRAAPAPAPSGDRAGKL
jgi:dolichol-phosphate mannosyltransferase